MTVEDLADIVCRCGRAYFVAGFPQRQTCQCGREVICISEGNCFCLSRVAARALDSLAEMKWPPPDPDSAAMALIADSIAPRDLEHGELLAIMQIDRLTRPKPEPEPVDEIERVARKYREKP